MFTSYTSYTSYAPVHVQFVCRSAALNKFQAFNWRRSRHSKYGTALLNSSLFTKQKQNCILYIVYIFCIFYIFCTRFISVLSVIFTCICSSTCRRKLSLKLSGRTFMHL